MGLGRKLTIFERIHAGERNVNPKLIKTKKEECISNCINDFWNTVGVQQIRAYGAPSVRTKEIKEYEAGKRSLQDVIPNQSTTNVGMNKDLDYLLNGMKGDA